MSTDSNQSQGQPTSAQRKSASWVVKTVFILIFAGTVGSTLIAGAAYFYFSRDLPTIIRVEDYRPLGVSQVFTGVGKEKKLVAEFFKERRYLIPYEKIPQNTIRAFISAEDDKFFEHQGINLSSILRASIANFRAGHVVQGGSTITQQVAKSLLLTPERSFGRKFKELILAGRIESNLTKQQILYLYLNQIYLGHGAYGVQAAARAYFNVDATELTIAQAALLAGLPVAPGKYSPLLNGKRAKERQLYVLKRMVENKYISQDEMQKAAAEVLKIYEDDDFSTHQCAYLVENTRKYLAEKYGEKALYEEGLTVSLPTSPEMCDSAQKSLQDGLRTVDKRSGYRGPIKNLKTNDEIEKQLREVRVELIKKKLRFQVFLPDGRTDALAAAQVAQIKSDAVLLSVGDLVTAVVTSFDEKKKSAGVLIGAVKAELPLEQVKWTKKPEPKSASQALARGDVILVKVLTNTEKEITVSLEQEPQIQGALFSMDVHTGMVLAMEGGYDFKKSEFNRAMQAQRQPGSAFKPIVYTLALERGYTPATVIVDAPIVYDMGDNQKWRPSNFEEKFYGDTLFRQALIKSRNVPTIKIAQSLQIANIIDFTKRLGIQGQLPADLSLSLGNAAISLLEMTKTYAIYPRLGRKIEPVFLLDVKDRDGKTLEVHSAAPEGGMAQISTTASPIPAFDRDPTAGASPMPGLSEFPNPHDPDQVMDPRVAYVATHIMNEVVLYGTGHEAKSLGRAAAGKTGTTQEYIDAWFMGFTPNIVTGVWVGNDSQKPIGQNETGARAALPIWLSFMKDAVKAYPDVEFSVPPGVVFANIDPQTGKLSKSNSSEAIREAFVEGTQPTEISSGKVSKPSNDQSEFMKGDIQ